MVATPIGNLEELSPRAGAVLRRADTIAAEDTRRAGRLLARLGVRTRLVSLHAHNEPSRIERIIKWIMDDGETVALVSDAGTPGISDPGGLLVRAAHEAGAPVRTVAGPSALSAALAVCGLPAQPFVFHGFLKTGLQDRKRALEGVRLSPAPTHVFFEAPHRIRAFAELAAEALPEAQAFFGRELTKMHETHYTGPIKTVRDLLAADPQSEKGEYTVVLHLPSRGGARPAGAPDAAGELSVEALVADAMARGGLSMKDAVAQVAKQTGLGRNAVYRCALRLQALFEKVE